MYKWTYCAHMCMSHCHIHDIIKLHMLNAFIYIYSLKAWNLHRMSFFLPILLPYQWNIKCQILSSPSSSPKSKSKIINRVTQWMPYAENCTIYWLFKFSTYIDIIYYLQIFMQIRMSVPLLQRNSMKLDIATNGK